MDSPVAVLPIERAQVRPSTPPWLSRAVDRLNPIIVKEVRQGLRTKTFWVFFALMLIGCLVIALLAFGNAQDSGFEVTGPYYFYAFFFALALVSFLIIPYSAYRSLVREREDETWVLLTLTGLGARRILRGKLGSSLVQAALYASAAGPFVLFSYYLNGVDLPTILITLALGFAYMLFLTSVAVSVGTLGQSRLMRAVIHLALLGGLLGLTGLGLTVAGALAFDSRSLIADKAFHAAVGLGLWLMASYGMLLFEAAGAQLSLSTEDYAKGPRLTALVQLVVAAGIVTFLWWANERRQGVAAAFSIGFCVHLGLVGMFFASDADGQARCHRGSTRWFSFLRPGALRGFRFILGLIAAVMVAALLMAAASESPGSSSREDFLGAIIAAPAYALLYLSLPIFVGKGSGSRLLSTAAGTRLLTLVMVFLACGLPPLVALVVGADTDSGTLNFFNPIISLFRIVDSKSTPLNEAPGMLLLWGAALFSVLAADRVLAARETQVP